jgi:hypothetical protein
MEIALTILFILLAILVGALAILALIILFAMVHAVMVEQPRSITRLNEKLNGGRKKV